MATGEHRKCSFNNLCSDVPVYLMRWLIMAQFTLSNLRVSEHFIWQFLSKHGMHLFNNIQVYTSEHIKRKYIYHSTFLSASKSKHYHSQSVLFLWMTKRLCPYQNSSISTHCGDTGIYLHVHKIPKYNPYEAHGLELLNDELLLGIMGELVGEEQVTVIKRRQGVDVDLSSLQGRGRMEWNVMKSSKLLLPFWPKYDISGLVSSTGLINYVQLVLGAAVV